MLDAAIRETKVAGMRVNVVKTKYIVRGDLAATTGTFTVEGAPIDECCKASRAYGRLKLVWKAQAFDYRRNCGCSRRWWSLTARRERMLTHWFTLIQQIVNRR